MDDLSMTLCEAMATIAKKTVGEIQFDRTILCSIIDTSEAEMGKYLVATLSSGSNLINKDNLNPEAQIGGALNNLAHISNTFEAYSKDTYSRGQYVYVLIPNGDFLQQKTIIGKYIADGNEPYKDFSPFDQFIDMTGNLVSNTDTFELVANSEKEIANDEPSSDTKPTLTVDLSSNPLSAFTRLGLRAQFSSRLSQQKCITGEYGIQVTLTVKDQIKDDKNQVQTIEREVPINLSSDNFIGNPYNFEGGYYRQELIFDISDYQSITKMDIRFYQRKDSFKNDQYINIPPYADDNKTLLEPNLFVKDIYIGVGYSAADIDKDTLFLYTLDDPTYQQTFNPPEHKPYQMARTLKVRWIHQDEDTGRYETVSDFSALHTSERTSAILQADTALQAIGTSLEENAKLQIATDFYKSYLGAMTEVRNGTIDDLTIGNKFNFILRTSDNLDEATVLSGTMTEAIRSSFINTLEQFVIDLFPRLHIYTWCQEETLNFSSVPNDITNYYTNIDHPAHPGVVGDALTIEPYYKYKNKLYTFQFDESLDAFTSGKAAANALAADKFFYLPAIYDGNVEIFIKLQLPDGFSTNCAFPSWRDIIEDLRSSVKNIYDKHQAIISSYQYQLRWYHYKLGATIRESDVYAGANWRRIDENFPPDDTLLNPSLDSLTDQPEVTFTPNPNKRQDQFKCILLKGYDEDQDKGKVVFDFTQSNIFTFSNRGKVIDVDTVEKVEALSIYCKDDSFGNYFIYNLGGEITNNTEAGRLRWVEAYFNPSVEEITNGPLREAQTINWTFPLDTYSYQDEAGDVKTIIGYTMLQPEISVQDIVSKTDTTPNHSDTKKMYILTSDTDVEKVYTRKAPQRYQYDKIEDVTDNYPDIFKIDIIGCRLIYTYKCFKDGSIFNSFGYKIKGFYTQQNTVNNSIGCSIVKDFVTYNAVKTFNFGPSGTQGAEVVLAVNFNRDKETLYNAVTQIEHFKDGEVTISNADFKPARFSAFLYDADSNLVDLSNVIITCEWAEDVIMYKDYLDTWFSIDPCISDGKWIDNIPTWEINYKPAYKDKKIADPDFEEVTITSPPEARRLAQSIKNARINAIVVITISDYGRYDKLKTYLPIPQKTISYWDDKKIAFVPGYISGPTKVIYDGTGHCDYYKGPYMMAAFVQDNWQNNIAGQWSLIYPKDPDKIDEPDELDTHYLPALRNSVLEPLGMYIEDVPRYAVAFSSDDFSFASSAVGKKYTVQDLANNNLPTERVMTQQLWDFLLDFVNTPVNQLQGKGFNCTIGPTSDTNNYTTFIWNLPLKDPDKTDEPDEEYENNQILANLFHGLFPHTLNQYNLYQGFINGNGKTYGWRVSCDAEVDSSTGRGYYKTLTFTKNSNNILDPRDVYHEVSDPTKKADFLSGFLDYFKTTSLNLKENVNCWYQPIYIGQNRYMSATLNQWDGQKLKIDEQNCEIVAHAVAAGKKEQGFAGAPVFTGVVIGQMTSEASDELSKHTGVYGINQGAMAYQFLDNGTGFIGKSGRGRIVFDGNTGVIKSGIYNDTDSLPVGCMIDFDDGRIELHGNTNAPVWNFSDIQTTSNLLVLANASDKLDLQEGPKFDGDVVSIDTTSNPLVSAVYNKNCLTITVKKNYLYTGNTWNTKLNDYSLVVMVGKTVVGDEQTLAPLLLKCVRNDINIEEVLTRTYADSIRPILDYKAKTDDETQQLVNTINFSSEFTALLTNFNIDYYLCTKDIHNMTSITLHNIEDNTENYESAEEGQKLDTSILNSYKTLYKKKLTSASGNIYAVAFKIPIQDSFSGFFDQMGNAQSLNLTFTLSLTRRTIPKSISQEGQPITAVGSVILDAGTLFINNETGKPDQYDVSGVPFSIGILNQKINQNEATPDVTNTANFYVEWDGTMHARNGYFTSKNNNNYVKISSNSTQIPLKIGENNEENFKVTWDGSLYSTAGYIGGWKIQREYLADNRGVIKLDPKHGVIDGPVLRGAEMRGGAIFTNDLHANFFTVYNWTKIPADSPLYLYNEGLQGEYSVDTGLNPPTKLELLNRIAGAKIGQVGLIDSSDGSNRTYPLGITATNGSIVLQVGHNSESGSSENIRFSVPSSSGAIIASLVSNPLADIYTTQSLVMLTNKGIQWGLGWGTQNDKFAILSEAILPPETWNAGGNFTGVFQGLSEFKIRGTNKVGLYGVLDEVSAGSDYNPSAGRMVEISHWPTFTIGDIDALRLGFVKQIEVTEDPINGTNIHIIGNVNNKNTHITIENVPAENQTGIYARFA